MAIFSQDQVRQFYIANANKVAPLKETDAAGTMAVKSSPQDVWFEYVTPNGDNGNTVVRTDLIPKSKITSITKTDVAATRKLQKVSIAINGDPVPGQEYIIRFVFYGLGIGGVENQYIKEGGIYKAKTGDTAKTIYEGLLASIERNFSREPSKYIKATLAVGDDAIEIEEVVQPWIRGKRQADPIRFDVFTLPIKTVDGENPWGTVTNITKDNVNTVSNGRMVADMEWFYIGERADQFRGYGYPNNFETNYLADASKAYKFINIDFYYSGDAEDVQRSKKTLTIATADAATLAALWTALGTAEVVETEVTP